MAGSCIAQSDFLGQIIKDRVPTTSGTSNYSADNCNSVKGKKTQVEFAVLMNQKRRILAGYDQQDLSRVDFTGYG